VAVVIARTLLGLSGFAVGTRMSGHLYAKTGASPNATGGLPSGDKQVILGHIFPVWLGYRGAKECRLEWVCF